MAYKYDAIDDCSWIGSTGEKESKIFFPTPKCPNSAHCVVSVRS